MRAGRCSIACRHTYVHSRAVFVQSTVRRFDRWLENDRIDVHALYGPFMPQALAEWGNHVLYLALDTAMWWDTEALWLACSTNSALATLSTKRNSPN